jgi:hypothetical protein
MKKALVIILSVLSLNSFAATISETIKKIEMAQNATCERTGGSLFNFCSSSLSYNGEPSVPYTCTYKAKFTCYSSEKDFRLKLKVVESYNPRTNLRESRVVKVKYIY